MAILSYSFADLSRAHTEGQHLRYISSSSFGTDWNGVLHSHECAELFYVTDGEGWFCTAEETVPLARNQMVIVNPKVHHTERSSSNRKMHYIVLGIDNLQFLFGKNDEFQPFHVFQLASHRETVLPLLQSILKEIQDGLPLHEELCQHYLSILLIQILRITGQNFTVAPPSAIPYECSRIKRYLDNHFQEPITLDVLAGMSHWDKFHLSHQFSKAYGISPINYLLARRIDHSRYLLQTTDYSITQIAESSGFSSQNYFSQIFKKNTGVSPRVYRKESQRYESKDQRP